MTGPRRPRRRRWVVSVVVALFSAGCEAGDPTRITVHPGQQLQVMKGWEGLIGGQVSCERYGWQSVKQRVLDLAALDLGMNRVRLPLRSGYESHSDLFPAFMRGEVPHDEWERASFRPQNDNDDPLVADPAGFQWAFLDHTVEEIVLPLKQRLLSRGDDLWVNLEYIGARRAAVHRDNSEEYAELVLATFDHLRDKYHLVPNSLEIVNEPALASWSPRVVAGHLLAARRRLGAAGYHPEFIGPSETTIDGSLRSLDSMLAVPGVREALTDVAYHRYSGGRDALRRIGRLATAGQFATAMLEFMGGNVDVLYEDLTVANVSAWQKFGMTACPASAADSDGVYVLIDRRSNVTNPAVRLGASSRFLRQYFRYVHLGAHRIGAESSGRRHRVTAFENRDGAMVVVVMSEGAGTLRVEGLPAARYGITATTADRDDATLGDTTVSAGATVVTRIPTRGVLTIFRK